MRIALAVLDARGVTPAQLRSGMAWLGADERARLERFTRERRRRQFVLGRVLARQLAGALLGVAPRELVLGGAPGAAPLLAGASLSIAHSGEWIAAAVAVGVKVGIDIEVPDPSRDLVALARQAFDDEALGRDPSTFYRAWCRAEAAFKLGGEEGHCIDLPHSHLTVALCTDRVLEWPTTLAHLGLEDLHC